MRRSTLVDTQVIYCGDNLDQLRRLPDDCVDLVYIDPPFNSNRNYEVFWEEKREQRSFDDRHESTKAYIDFMRPRCVELARVLKTTGSFYYHCDWHATACRVMAKRMRDACGLVESEGLWKAHRGFVVRDLPWSEERLRKLPPFEFENWAVVTIGGIPNAAQVGDMGIDGRLFPVTSIPKHASVSETFAFMDDWFPIQVKQKDKAGRPDIDSFEAVMVRENRTLGYFVAFAYSADAEREVRRFKASSGREIRLLRVEELIDIDHERMVDKKKPVGRVEQLTLHGTRKKLG
jgi:DNA methylase